MKDDKKYRIKRSEFRSGKIECLQGNVYNVNLIRQVPALGAVKTDNQGVCIYLNNRFYTEKVRPGFIPSETQLKRNPLPERDALHAFFRTVIEKKEIETYETCITDNGH